MSDLYSYQHRVIAPDSYKTGVHAGIHVTVTADADSAGRVAQLVDVPKGGEPDVPGDWLPINPGSSFELGIRGRWVIQADQGVLIVRSVPR